MSHDALAVRDISIGLEEKQSDLPLGWAWAHLGQLVTYRNEKIRPDRSSALPFIGMDDVPPGSLRATSHAWFRDMKSAANAVGPGEILYGRLRPYLNKVALAESSAAASGEFIVLQPRAGIDARYVQFALHSRRFVNFSTRDTSGDRPRIDFDKISKFELPVPPAAEQPRIVARIDELFAEIAEGEAALKGARQGLDTWRRALLKAAVTGELTRNWRKANRPTETGADLLARIRAHTGTSSATSRTRRSSASLASLDARSLPKLPEGWAWAPLKRQTECPILRISAVRPMAVDASDIRYLDENSAHRLSEFRTHAGDLLFTRYNGSRHLVGVCGIFREGEPVYYPDKIIRVRLVPQLQEISAFFEAATNSGATRKFIDREIKTTAGQHGISGASLKYAPIPIPPVTEAKRIVELLRDDLSRAEDMEALQAADFKSAAALRQSILKTAFEGQLVPQNPADEPASTLLARLRDMYTGNGAGRRPTRASAQFSHPSLQGLTRQSVDPRVKPAGED
jgi:type I restriction enzyme S subunit